MARTYNGSSQYAEVSAGLGIAGNDPVWASFWFWPNSTAASYGVFNIGVSGSTNHYRRVTSGGGNILGSSGGAGTNASATTALAGAAQWQHVLVEWGGTTSRKIAVNGAAPGTNATSINITSAPNLVRLAATMNLSAYMAGRLAWIGVFSGVPTDDQKAAAAAGLHPILLSPSTLLDAWDKFGIGTETSWRGNTLTLVNSPTQSDSPRIYLPHGRSMIVVPSGAAGQDLTLPAIASTETLAAPTLAAGAVTLTLPAIASSASLFAPTLAAGAVALGLPVIAAGAVLSAPTLAAGAVSLVLPAIASGASLAAPTVAAGAVTVALPAIAATSTVFAPTVVGAGALVLPAIASTATLAPPTLTAGAVTVALPAIASVAATYAPTLASGVTLALPAIAAQSALYGPTLVPGVSTLALPWLSSTTELYSPTIVDGIIPTYTTLLVAAARAGTATIAARAGRTSIAARSHLS
jgi:hypothetical protein